MYDCFEKSKNEKAILTTKKMKKNIELTNLIFAVVLGFSKRNPKTKKPDSESSTKLDATSNWLFTE